MDGLREHGFPKNCAPCMRVCVCVRVCVCASMLCELRDYYIRNKRIFGREKDAQKRSDHVHIPQVLLRLTRINN